MVAGTEVTRSETILYEKSDGVAWVTLNRPERMNALNTELRGAMARALRDASEDEGVYTVIVTGAGGRAFSAGNDLKAVAEAHASGIAPGQEERATDTYDLGDCPKPTIAAVDGYAVAGGMEVTLRCDIRIATEKSVFGLPEVKRGRMPGPGLTMLQSMIPMGEARWIQLTGEHMTAQRAYDIGLIQALLPDRDALFTEAERLAGILKGNAPLSVEAIKRVINASAWISPEFSQMVGRAERALVDRSEDIREGARAFAEKRPAVWQRR